MGKALGLNLSPPSSLARTAAYFSSRIGPLLHVPPRHELTGHLAQQPALPLPLFPLPPLGLVHSLGLLPFPFLPTDMWTLDVRVVSYLEMALRTRRCLRDALAAPQPPRPS